MKLTMRILALVLAVTFVLAGCGVDDPTEPSIPAYQPSVPTTWPTEPTVPPTQPTEPSVPATQPTEPSVPATQPTEPSVPATQPTEPSVPATQPTEPSVPPTQPTEPSVPPTQPTEPTTPSAPETAVESITLQADRTQIEIGEQLQISAIVLPEDAAQKSVTWTATGGSVNQNGMFSAEEAGSYTVTAYADDGSGVSGSIVIEVTPVRVSKITISGEKTVHVGDTLRLSASVQPNDAADKSIKWSISKGDKYATIDQDGVLTAVAAGSVTVKATAQDGSGVSATFKITVEKAAMWSGSGTKDDPFLIRCLEDLLNLRNVLDKSGYHYRQVADIDCSGMETWVVIGDEEHPFRHHIDGGGYTISNLCFDGEATALFSFVKDSHFKNMNIVNAHNKDNHQTYENKTGKNPGNGGYTAAIVGYGEGCSFENCTATVNFQSSNHTTGGLIGFVVLKNKQYTLMKDCHVSGTVTGNGYVGGLIGKIWNYMDDGDYAPASTITVCNSSADVKIVVFTPSSETPCIGGLIGESFGVKIEKCHAKGSIQVIEGDIGGLVGNAGNYTDVSYCYAAVDIPASSDDHYGGVSAGGLIGHIYSRSDVHDCYATGNITAPYVEWSPCQDDSPRNGGPWRRYYNPCGSLIGTLEVFRAYSEDEKITVYNCYATGKVDVPNICEDERVYCHGALIGLILDRYTVSNVIDKTKDDQSSWDDFSEHYIGHFENNYNFEALRTYYMPLNDYAGSNIYGMQNPKYSAMPTWEYVEILDEAGFRNQASFEGWDFETVWIMGQNGPELRQNGR